MKDYLRQGAGHIASSVFLGAAVSASRQQVHETGDNEPHQVFDLHGTQSHSKHHVALRRLLLLELVAYRNALGMISRVPCPFRRSRLRYIE
eukprot:COSAG03_NODE_2345_length_2863_cov_33.607698_3_plen_91_part_00